MTLRRLALLVAALTLAAIGNVGRADLASAALDCGAGQIAVKAKVQVGLRLALKEICVATGSAEAVIGAASEGSTDPCDYVVYDGTGPIKDVQSVKTDSGDAVDGLSPPDGKTWADGYLLFTRCDGSLFYSRQWVPNGAEPLANPVDLAMELRSDTPVSTPAMSLSPDWTLKDGRKATLKKAETWFWVSDKTTWKTLTPRLEAGPVWVEATITPTQILIDPGDGGVTETLACEGSGTPVPDATPISTPSPDCSVRFLQETDGGTWPVSVTVRYTVTWRGFDGTNLIENQTLDDLISAPVVYPLAVITTRTQLIDPNSPSD